MGTVWKITFEKFKTGRNRKMSGFQSVINKHVLSVQGTEPPAHELHIPSLPHPPMMAGPTVSRYGFRKKTGKEEAGMRRLC